MAKKREVSERPRSENSAARQASTVREKLYGDGSEANRRHADIELREIVPRPSRNGEGICECKHLMAFLHKLRKDTPLFSRARLSAGSATAGP
jgi:hypothetical protein